MRGILNLNKYQEEKKDDIALSKILKQQAKEKKIARPANISREVFALMTPQDIADMQNKEKKSDDKEAEG